MPTLNIKDYIYIAALLVLAIGFSLFVRHERMIGEAKVVAADAKAVTLQEQRDSALQTVAALAISIGNKTYETTVTTPVAPVTPISCVRHDTLGPSPVSAASSPDGSATAPSIVGSADSGVAPALPDLAAALVQIGHDDDAYIADLENEIATLRKEMTSTNEVRK